METNPATPIADSHTSPLPPTPLMILAILPKTTKGSIQVSDQDQHLKRWPIKSEVIEEVKQICSIACPMVISGLLLYGKAVISMLFMGRLGKEVLAGGSLSIGFANITGYSVLSGLSMGMEAISAQAFGANEWSLMALTLQRTIMILLAACLPIGLIWLRMEPILLWCGQDPTITAVAATYLTYSLPDLLSQALLNPLRIYLRAHNLTLPQTLAAAIALALHIPINYFLVFYLGLGIRGVALAVAGTNLNLLGALLIYLWSSTGPYDRVRKSWEGWSLDCFREWKPLLNLAIPSCLSVCLEWWWYELMIIFSGLLINASNAVATMGILIQTTSLVYIFPSALSLAVSTRIGNELGANCPTKARISMLVSLSSAFLVGFIAMAFTIAMRNVWGRFFTSDPSVVSLTAVVMPIVGLCELGNCPQTTGCGVLRGSARPSLGANINLGSFYAVGMPVAMLLGFVLDVGFLGLWLGLLAAQGTCAGLMLFVLLKTDWILEANRARDLIGRGCCSGNSDQDDSSSTNYRVENQELEALISIKVVHPN